MILALWLACGPDEGPMERAAAAVATGDMVTANAEIAAAGDANAQDLVRIRLAERFPDRGAALCAPVTTDYGRDKCQKVLGRPHLQSKP